MDELAASAVVPLSVSRSAAIDLEYARAKLRVSDFSWLGTVDDHIGEGGRRTFQSDLGLSLRAAGRQIAMHKAALVEIGPPQRTNGHLTMEVCWRATKLAPLFPVFAGWLTVKANQLRLDGIYAPPLGRIGVALDRALLGIAARRTARWFLDHLTTELRRE
jgi:hypothetical protein